MVETDKIKKSFQLHKELKINEEAPELGKKAKVMQDEFVFTKQPYKDRIKRIQNLKSSVHSKLKIV